MVKLVSMHSLATMVESPPEKEDAEVESEEQGMNTLAYRIDIDGTIGEPQFYAPDFWETARHYIAAGLVTEEEVVALRTENHQRLWLLPQVLLTHIPLPGAVQAVQQLAQRGTSLHYFTVRQALDAKCCEQVHEKTRVWLAQEGFPFPKSVAFFWDAANKLRKALEAPEDRIALIDDRPAGLLHAYQRIAGEDPVCANEIQKRVILLAFGSAAMDGLPQIENAPEILPLADWFHLSELLSQLGEKFIDTPTVVPYSVGTAHNKGD